VALPHAHRRLAERDRLVDEELRPRLAALIQALLAEVSPQVVAAAA
jgi:hypothetical protein